MVINGYMSGLLNAAGWRKARELRDSPFRVRGSGSGAKTNCPRFFALEGDGGVGGGGVGDGVEDGQGLDAVAGGGGDAQVGQEKVVEVLDAGGVLIDGFESLDGAIVGGFEDEGEPGIGRTGRSAMICPCVPAMWRNWSPRYSKEQSSEAVTSLSHSRTANVVASAPVGSGRAKSRTRRTGARAR